MKRKQPEKTDPRTLRQRAEARIRAITPKDIMPLAFGSRRIWAGLFGVIILGLVAGGYGFHRVESRRIYLDKYNQLAAIGELKASQIAEWRRERLNDSRSIAESPFVVKGLETWLKDSGNLALRDACLQHLQLEQRTEDCADALLLDVNGRVLLAAKDAPGPVDSATTKAVALALDGRQAVLSDLYRSPDSHMYMDAVAPVWDADNRPIAVVVLRTDAAVLLYPLIQSWPIPSRSAETLLVQKEGDHILFLNELRHKPDTALLFRIPLIQSGLPGVQAVLGKEGVCEGKDYRGVEVLSDLRAIPGSPWFMVAKVDASEILAEAYYRTQIAVVFVVLFILLSAAVVALAYRQRQARLYRDLYASERETRRAQDLLQESEARYRCIVETANEGVWAVDRDQRTTFVNARLAQMLGYEPAEMLGRSVEDFVLAEDLPAYRQHMVQRRNGQDGSYDHRFRCSDGSEVWTTVSATAMIDAQGEFDGSFAMLTDITERKQAEEETTRAQQTLLEQQRRAREHAEIELHKIRDALVRQTRLATIGQVAASIAHDLRNPLAAVRNAAFFLKRKLPKNAPDLTDYPAMIEKDVDRCNRIITNLIDVARAKPVVKHKLDLGNLVQTAIDASRQADHIHCRMLLAEDPFVIRGDPDQLRQVLVNLLCNAVEATERSAEVTIEAKHEADEDVVIVRDEGPGVPLEIREHIFQPLFTGKAKGTGMGLTICQQIMEHHGGKIELVDDASSGAVFALRLPRRKETKEGRSEEL